MLIIGTQIDFVEEQIKASYSAADSLPVKVLLNDKLLQEIKDTRVIPPYHVQLIPTNKCNLSCGYCSCSDEDREVELDVREVKKIISELARLGTKSVTITGGGEPLLHSDIEDIIWMILDHSIKVGLVTNGMMLNAIGSSVSGVTWCRISHSDDREFDGKYYKQLWSVVDNNPCVDWAFSYVVSPEPNLETISRVLEFANDNDFRHVRMVADLLQTDKVDLGKLRQRLEFNGVNDDRVIYQSRNVPEHGGPCYICCLKPVIGADAKVYPCCGVQYALDEPSRKLADVFCLGDAEDMERIVKQYSETPFDGSICKRCYYGSYNRVLKLLFLKVEHADFV